jgi:hypothetical protein
MDFESTSGILIPYIISNAIALLTLWLSFRKPRLAKRLLGVIFLCAGAFNFYTAFSNPSVYLDFADTTFLGFYRDFIRGFFADHVVWIVSAIASAQLCISLSMMCEDWRFKTACLGAIIFLIAIAPFGIGSAFPCTLILSLSFLRLLVVAGRDRNLDNPQRIGI